MKNNMKFIAKTVCVFICCVFLFSGCSATSHNKALDIGVSEDNEALKYFVQMNDGKEIIKCAEEDVNGDSQKDLVLIYKASKDKNSMVIVIRQGDGFELSEEAPAPKENQKIKFKDIDNKTPIEIIVSGSKGSNIGYAIFRLEGKKLIDLFAEGMEDCC